MIISNIGLNLIKYFEGFSSNVYLCSGGYKTIGYGHKLLNNEKFYIVSKEEATQLLIKDVKIAEYAVNRLIKVKLNQNQFDALVSFTFNLGSGALQSSTLRRIINRENYKEASYQFKRWVYAGGKKLLGLVRRRNAEFYLFNAI